MQSALYITLIFSTILFHNKAHSIEVTYENLKTIVEKNSLNIEAWQSDDKRFFRPHLPEVEVFAAQESFKEGNKAQHTQPTFGAEVKYNIFNGRNHFYDTKKREVQINNKRFTYQRTKNVRETYWKYIYSIESINLINEMIELNKSNLKSVQQRIKAGVATQTDRYEFELKSIDLKQRLKEITLSSENLKRQIKFLLNLNNTEDFTVTGSLQHDHNYTTELNYKKSDFDFLYNERDLASDLEVLKSRMPKSIYWPRVDLYASYKQHNQLEIDMPNSEDRVEKLAGVKLSINLNEAIEHEREAKATLLEATTLVNRARYQKHEFGLHVEKEILELDLLHSQIHDSDLSIEIANKYFKTTLAEFARGVKGSADVLSVSEKLFETKNKKLEIIRDFQISKSNVLSMIGQ